MPVTSVSSLRRGVQKRFELSRQQTNNLQLIAFDGVGEILLDDEDDIACYDPTKFRILARIVSATPGAAAPAEAYGALPPRVQAALPSAKDFLGGG